MPVMETLLSEMFGFQLFERDSRLQDMIDDTLYRYDDDMFISADDLAAAAGGIAYIPPDKGGSE